MQSASMRTTDHRAGDPFTKNADSMRSGVTSIEVCPSSTSSSCSTTVCRSAMHAGKGMLSPKADAYGGLVYAHYKGLPSTEIIERDDHWVGGSARAAAHFSRGVQEGDGAP